MDPVTLAKQTDLTSTHILNICYHPELLDDLMPWAEAVQAECK